MGASGSAREGRVPAVAYIIAGLETVDSPKVGKGQSKRGSMRTNYNICPSIDPGLSRRSSVTDRMPFCRVGACFG